jgi:GNAT superfamily N-acetyltransferase
MREARQINAEIEKLTAPNLFNLDARELLGRVLSGQWQGRKLGGKGGFVFLRESPFDSAYFKRPVWMIDYISSGADSLLLQALKTLPRRACVLYRQDVSNGRLLERLQEKEFKVLCPMVDLYRPAEKVEAAAKKIKTRLFKKSDLPALKRIARTTFRFSRYHVEPLLPLKAANALHAEWIENLCLNALADQVWVAEYQNKVAGFHAVKAQGSMARTALIGVDSALTGSGVGRALMQAALIAYPGFNFRVRTEAANVAAVRLYLSCGFRYDHASLYLRRI